MRPHRSHFSIGRKTALEAWKFIKGDHVIVTTGRSVRAPVSPGFKGAKGVITKVVRDPRNPRVHIENVRKRVRVATASGYQDKEVPKKIHISNIAHLRGAVGQEVPSRVRFLEVKDRSGQAQTQKKRVYVNDAYNWVPSSFVKRQEKSGKPRKACTADIAHKQTYFPPARLNTSFAASPLTQ